jgi:uncharacterized membrane protein YeaQ/YmgE (transglycosylase-associated protein family)
MQTSQAQGRLAGSLAFAYAAVIAFTIPVFILFLEFGDPFGSATDISVAVAAVLGALLATRLFPSHRVESPRSALLALLVAWIGAGIVCIGSYLVVGGVTGWFLANLYMVVGYALIGLWLLIHVLTGNVVVAPTPSARWLPLSASLVMATGFLALPGIIAKVDNPALASSLVNASTVSIFGSYVLFPIWAVIFGRRVRAAGQP